MRQEWIVNKDALVAGGVFYQDMSNKRVKRKLKVSKIAL